MGGGGEATGGSRAAAAGFAGAPAVLLAAELANVSLGVVAPLVALAVVTAVGYRTVLRWSSLVCLVVLVILFIPIKRYILPGNLPFQLEPYRLLVALVCLAWVTSLLIDPRVRLRRSGFDKPLLLYLLVIVSSLAANPHRTVGVFSDVLKSLVFFASFIILFYVIVSVVRRRREIEAVVQTLVVGGTLVARSAIVESRTHYNVFDHLSAVMPFTRFTGSMALARSGRLRVVASAQHPIALGAALVMLVPLTVYRIRLTRRWGWWACMVVLLLGALATSSRTAITMLLTIGVVYLSVYAREMRRMWPAIVPILIVVHFAIPGALGTTYESFFPKGGLIAQQQNAPAGHARLSSLGPALRDEFSRDPVLGEGFATRITPSAIDAVGPQPTPNAPILDDQWLDVLCETGAAGAFALGWLFVRFFRRLRGEARRDRTPRSALLVALAASVVAYAVGMLTYDAYSFIQVTFLVFICLGLGSAALLADSAEWTDEQTPGERQRSLRLGTGRLSAAEA